MDIRCPKCGEPWDHDSLHEQAEYVGLGVEGEEYQRVFSRVLSAFVDQGCAALTVYQAKCTDNVADPLIAAIWEMGGDDIDGIAADLKDWQNCLGTSDQW